ncbi:MAG: phage tail tube protein [Pseudomonadota bacterium]
MSNATLGYGAKLLMHDGTAAYLLANYAEIGEISTGPDDDESISEVNVTNHQSPGRRLEKIAGLIDGGSINITCNYIPGDATQDRATGLQSLFATGEVRRFLIIEPGNTQAIQVDCFVSSRATTRPVEDKMEISFNLTKTGNETLVAIPT